MNRRQLLCAIGVSTLAVFGQNYSDQFAAWSHAQSLARSAESIGGAARSANGNGSSPAELNRDNNASSKRFVNSLFAFNYPAGLEIVESWPRLVVSSSTRENGMFMVVDHGLTLEGCALAHNRVLGDYFRALDDIRLWSRPVTTATPKRAGTAVTSSFDKLGASMWQLTSTTVCAGTRGVSVFTLGWRAKSKELNDGVVDSLQLQPAGSQP